MYIESKLIEVNETLFSRDFSHNRAPTLIKEEVNIQSYSWLQARCKIQISKGLFIVETFFENEKDITDIFSVSGE